MGMFDTVGNRAGQERSEKTLKKLERMRTALSGKEPDRQKASGSALDADAVEDLLMSAAHRLDLRVPIRLDVV